MDNYLNSERRLGFTELREGKTREVGKVNKNKDIRLPVRRSGEKRKNERSSTEDC